MTTVANNPFQKLEDHFKIRLDAGVNTSNVSDLVSYIGKFIKKGAHLTTEDGVQHQFSPQMILLAARNVFSAKHDSAEKIQKNILTEGLTTLEKAFADKNLANILKLSLEVSAENYTVIRNNLIDIHSQLKQSTDGSPDLKEQQALLQGLINQAEVKAHNFDSNTTDTEVFSKELNVLLIKNMSHLTKEGVSIMLESINSLGLAVNSFGLFDELPDSVKIAGHLKYTDEAQGVNLEAEFSKGNFNNIPLAERKQVLKLFQDIVTSYKENISLKGMSEEKARALAHSQLLPKLGELGDSQIAYFKHLSSQYKELKTQQPGEWLTHLSKSLPGLVMPGIMGAIIAYVFGLSAELGAIGAAALSFLGRESSTQEPTTITPPKHEAYDASSVS